MYPITIPTTFTNQYYIPQDNMIHDQQHNSCHYQHQFETSNIFIKKEQDFTFNQDLLLTSGYYPNSHLSDTNIMSSPPPPPPPPSSDMLTYQYQYDMPCSSTYSPSSSVSHYSSSSFSPIESTGFDFYSQLIEENGYFYQPDCDTIFTEEWPVTLDSLLPIATSNTTLPTPIVKSSHTKTNDVRPYQCHMCRRAFARKHDLQRHIRVHTGDKPYSCPCCKKAFARTDALKRHLRMEEQCRTSPEVLTMKKNGGRHFRNLKIHTT